MSTDEVTVSDVNTHTVIPPHLTKKIVNLIEKHPILSDALSNSMSEYVGSFYSLTMMNNLAKALKLDHLSEEELDQLPQSMEITVSDFDTFFIQK